MINLCASLLQSRAAVSPIPTEADLLINKAQAAYNRGDAPVALELANKAVAVAPSNPQAYWVRGRIYSAQAEHTKAIADFDKALQLEPRGAELYHLREDPGEMRNLGSVPAQRGRIADLSARIRDWQRRHGDSLPLAG